MSTTILITGVNRGIGAGLIKAYISQPNHTVIAAVRDPSHKTTIALSSLPAASNSKLLVVAYDASREGSASSAVADLQARGVSHLDIVIANAGIAKWWGPVLEAPRSEMLSHFTVNTLGALELYQATRPLLAKGKTEGIDGLPKFAYISTTLGSIGATEDYPFPAVAYGTSKAAMNYVVKRAHLDNKDVDTLRSIQGACRYVQTDMAVVAGAAHGILAGEITVGESVEGLVREIAKATKEKTPGRACQWNGCSLLW